ncbi:MAG: PEP-CTERM/exosortase system-associated acyltransferase [Rugosibacter sp.]|nr:MAG: PEP-CTERM/exosortase system-associated acyltransferase [Rugosibacter sp.]
MMLNRLLGRDRRDPLTPNFKFFGTAFTRAKESICLDIMKLRYEVYCNECHFLNADDYPDGCEADAYDANAYHVAACNEAGQVVGAVRLVFANQAGCLPFEGHCATFDDFSFPPRAACAEVSRLVVNRGYRRRPGDTMQGMTKRFVEEGRLDAILFETDDPEGKHRRRISPQIFMGMFRQIYQHSRKNGIHYWFAAMEKSLARSLDRMGFHYTRVGPETDYYGPVAVYYADLRQLSADLRKSSEFLSRWFEGQPITLWLILKTWIRIRVLGHKKI